MSRVRCFSSLLIGWALLFSHILRADPVPESQDYLLRNWDMGEGLPANTVPAITQTSDGYLWLATWNGLVRFDGHRFTVMRKDTVPGLASHHLRTVFAARDGWIWLGLENGGVARMKDGRCEIVTPLPPPSNTSLGINSIAEDADGAIWLGSIPELEVFRWKNGKISRFSGDDGIFAGFATHLHTSSEGRLWVTTTEMCAYFDGTRFQPVDPEGGGGPRLAAAREGGMWAARGELLLHYQKDGTREVIADLGGLGGASQISSMLEDRAGNLWIGTTGAGLFRYREGKFVRVPTTHTAIASLFEDREENLWVGTQGGGLDCLRRRIFALRQTRNGLPNEVIASLAVDTAESLWMVGMDGSVVVSVDATNQSFKTPSGGKDWNAYVLCPDNVGGMWSGGFSGLGHWRDGIFRRVGQLGSVTSLLLDRQADLWVATVDGPLVLHREGVDLPMPVADGLIETRALAEDGAGRIWVGTEKGVVFQRKQGNFVRVPLPGATVGEPVRFIVPDRDDTVWIGTHEGGLYRWRAGRVTRLPADAGLPLDDLRVMSLTAEGDFWFGTGGGLLRVARGEIEDAMDRRKPSMRVVTYGRNDGLPSVEFSYGFRNSTVRTRDGHLWFGTFRGALEVIPRKIQNPAPQLTAIVEEIRVGGMSMPIQGSGPLVFPPRPGQIETRYTVPQLSAPEQMRFRYRLTGSGDDGWIPAGNQRMAVFPRLPPGDYRFEVTAAEADGPWLPQVASLAFIVRPEWWEMVWFIPAVILLGGVLLGVGVRTVVKRRMLARVRKLQQERALEKERSRIARDMHDQVGANLTQISLLSELATTPEAIAELGAAARRAVDALDSIVWAVNPKKDTLASLLQYLVSFAEDFLNSADVRCRVDFSTEVPQRHLPPEFRHHVFLVVKEALHNAVKYSRASEVRLGAEFGATHLTITVSDNGIGFETRRNPDEGDGLQNMRDRAAALGGECLIKSHPHTGTRITLTAPWQAANTH